MTQLTIGIDASRAVKQNRTGTEIYGWEIIKELAEIDRENHYFLYAPYLPKDRDAIKAKNFKWCILEQRRLWSQVRLARELKRNPPDVLFIPSHVVPVFSNIPSVVTIHDIAYEYFPRAYSYLQRRYLNFSTGVSIAKAKAVIVPSESTKRDLNRKYKNYDQKIVVIPHGYNEEIYNTKVGEVEPPPMQSPFILYIGRIEEKKNLRLLIDAFTLFAKEKKSINLVLAGSSGYGFDRIRDKIQSLPDYIRERILLPGYLPQYDMVRLLKSASLFAYPSFYEGFGLPVLEAMAVGTPAVCSNSSSLPEVAGDAAILLPPSNPLSWAAAFSRIINQPKFAQGMVEKGLKQAHKFSWRNTAEKTLEVILNAAKA